MRDAWHCGIYRSVPKPRITTKKSDGKRIATNKRSECDEGGVRGYSGSKGPALKSYRTERGKSIWMSAWRTTLELTQANANFTFTIACRSCWRGFMMFSQRVFDCSHNVLETAVKHAGENITERKTERKTVCDLQIDSDVRLPHSRERQNNDGSLFFIHS